MTYFMHIGVLIAVYVLLVLSLNIMIGYCGRLSLCHAAFYGVGAYCHTLMVTRYETGYFLAFLSTVVLTSVVSFAIAYSSLRLKGDYFVLATLGFQMLVYAVLYNWVSFTRGVYGITSIPFPSLFGFEIDTPFRYFFFSWILTIVCFGIIWLLIKSPFGRVVEAVRDNDIAAAAFGKNVSQIRIISFILSAIFAAIGGVLYSGFMQYIDPTSFDLNESILIVTAVVIGGAGTIRGSLIGALIIVLLPEFLRLLDISGPQTANLRQIAYGLLLIILMRIRPRGIFGKYDLD